MKLNVSMELMKAMDFARDEAMRTGSFSVGADHLMLGILREGTGPGCEALESLGVNLQEMKQFIDERIFTNEHVAYDQKENVTYSPQAHSVLSIAVLHGRRFARTQTTSLEVVMALCSAAGTVSRTFLQENGVNPERLGAFAATWYADHMEQPAFNEKAAAGPVPGAMPSPEDPAAPSVNNLEDFGYDMTAAAAEGKFKAARGRSTEIGRIMQILGRRDKNNPMLVGEPGSGKSAIVEHVALLLSKGEVPDSIKGKVLFSLDIASVVAGTKFRGEFEKRLKDIIREVKERGNIILFIDEFHTIVGAGETTGGGLDAASLLRPALSRGEIHCIGCITPDEYSKVIQKDKSMDRCFQKVEVAPTDASETLKILQLHKSTYEDHHNVRYSDEALSCCVKLADRYIQDRCFPDKAMDVMDEAGSMVRLRSRSRGPARVGAADVSRVISMMSGVPVERVAKKESQKLLKMEEKLSERIICQDEAVGTVARAIRRSRSGIKDPRRPIGTFMFLGPTGVGKTQLAKSLADYLFDSEDNMVRIDMSEYGDKINVSRLVGAPPGYVGYDQGGQLSEAVRRKPYCVVLLDEIEKAHPDVFNLLLQVLDDGRLTDSFGRSVNFRNTIIIMTSNVGSREMEQYGSGLGFSTGDDPTILEGKRKGVAVKAVKQTFPPEFLNRVDEQVFFHSLGKAELASIVDIELKGLRSRLAELGYRLDVSTAARKFIAEWGYDPAYGARPLKRAVRKWVEDPVSEYLTGHITAVKTAAVIKIDMNAEKDGTAVYSDILSSTRRTRSRTKGL
ncbi:MAG: ATP-dependent Clp protease ATP-binding subunit [Bacteroidales bacterium]|nr:ATP-dependent Clp protease ATP-binding subunit [Bacteroidales bacterium]